jgi:hypothetical protein
VIPEACETTDFFEPDKVYVRIGGGPPRLTALKPEFWCKSVFTHPNSGKLFAVGLFRNGDWQCWHVEPVHRTLDDWRRVRWVEKEAQ